jgi:hypothetical protein
VVRLHEPLRGGETQAGTARLGREEGGEDLLPDCRRDAGSAVDEGDATEHIGRFDRDADSPLAAHGVRAIDQEIQEYDLQQLGVGQNGRDAFPHVDANTVERRIAGQQPDVIAMSGNTDGSRVGTAAWQT